MEPLAVYFIRLALIVMIAMLVFKLATTELGNLFVATASAIVTGGLLLLLTPLKSFVIASYTPEEPVLTPCILG